jgi:hypothetical protein
MLWEKKSTMPNNDVMEKIKMFKDYFVATASTKLHYWL